MSEGIKLKMIRHKLLNWEWMLKQKGVKWAFSKVCVLSFSGFRWPSMPGLLYSCFADLHTLSYLS